MPLQDSGASDLTSLSAQLMAMIAELQQRSSTTGQQATGQQAATTISTTQPQLQPAASNVVAATSNPTSVGGSHGSGAQTATYAASQVQPNYNGASFVGGSTSAEALAGAQQVTYSQQQPHGFLWNGKWFYLVAPPGGINMSDTDAIRNRVAKSVAKHQQNEGVEDFSITEVKLHDVLASSHADLLALNPNALFVADTYGTLGNGQQVMIPVVVNADGSTYVDPRIRW